MIMTLDWPRDFLAAEPEASAPLGVLVYDDSVEADRVLTQAARILADGGLRLAGVVQSNLARPGRRKCDMRLTDLTTGEAIDLSLDRGPEAVGCRLDAGALAQASHGAERALADGADLLIVNRFGKQEAMGQGFRTAIGEALATGVPVVLGVSQLNLEACMAFVDGALTRLAPDAAAIADWAREALRARRAAAGAV